MREISDSRHQLKVVAYPRYTRIWYWRNRENMLTHMLYLTPDNQNFADPIELINTTNEIMTTSKSKDSLGNKDCHHTYSEIDANLALMQAGAKECKPVNETGTFPSMGYFHGYHPFFSDYTVGKGYENTPGNYWVVDEVSPSRFSARNMSQGRVYNTLSVELLTCRPGASPIDPVYIEYKRSNIFSQWVKDENPYISDQIGTWNENAYPQYLTWISDEKSLPSSLELERLILGESDTKLLDHFIPDDFTDRLYETLTIPDVNNIENLKDLKNIQQSLPPIMNLLKKRNFKSLSEFYLWYKYSYSTTKLDLKAYYDFFVKWAADSKLKQNLKRTRISFNSSTPNTGNVSRERTYHEVVTKNYNSGVLETLGLSLNLGNTWDLIPFSFVVDWFINLGDILARIDHTEVLSKMDVISVISTTKREKFCTPLASIGCASVCHVVNYQRDISHSIPEGNISLSLKNPISHIADGTALYVATRR